LVQQGHQRIAFLLGTPDTITTTWRESIFRALMREFNLPVPDSYVEYGDWWLPEPNDRAARQLLHPEEDSAGTPRPTAILCAGDPIAMTVLNVARALHIHVPRQLSVVGYANYTLATYADPALTTVEEPFHEMGRFAVKRLLERIAAEGTARDDRPLNEVLPTRLVVRSSTAPPEYSD
jgi:LacI family transcriptional regulator